MSSLSKAAKSLWGKKAIKNGQELWLPLIAHLIDTKNVINWLYNHWLSDKEQLIIESSLPNQNIHALVKFLGCVHDYGKCIPAFQGKPSYQRSKVLDQDLLERLLRQGLSSIKLVSMEKSPHAVAGEALLERAGLNESVGAIIGGHHGMPQKTSPFDQIINYTSNYFGSDQNQKIKEKWQRVQSELLNYILEICGYNNIKDVPPVSQPVAVILEGLLIMADWLASSEYLNYDVQKPLFPLISLNAGFDDLDMTARFEDAINTWAVNDEWYPQKVTNIEKHYQKRWGFEPRSVQEKMSAVIGKTKDPGMIIIEAPMGIGKTEIALTAAEQLGFSAGENGFFMGLPTQATSNAMFERIDQWLKQVAESEHAKLPIKLMHGKAQFNPIYRAIPIAENIDSDSDSDADSAVVVNSWFTGKKTILNEFSVGTIDNLLLMGLKQKHLFLKHLGLANKIVVIDEVHAYDVYMTSYLKKVLRWLGAYHVPVIALSATLPKQKRNELLQAYCKGKFGTKHFQAESGWENEQSYPLLSILDGKKMVQVNHFEQESFNKISVHIRRLKADDMDLVNKISATIEKGGIAGVIVNTVRRAQQLARLMPKGIPTLILHSAYLSSDRTKREQKLQNLIGKNGKRPKRLIVIGTQVLEQSLDIDFDVLFTDIAPMDLILQRIGRLHRHQIERPVGLQQPDVYILGINSFGDYGDANEAIYAKYLLMKTDHFLPNQIKLPTDISPLVQTVYDPENDEEVHDLDEAKSEFEDQISKLKKKAAVFQIAPPRPRRTIHGWLGDSPQNLDKDEVRAQAAVRDIKDTLEVVLLQKNESGFCLLDGRKLEKVSSKIIAEQTIRLPAAVTPNIDEAISSLEDITSKNFSYWQKDIWLRGSLALVLDKNLTANFNGWTLSYSSKLGLSYEKEGEKGE